ncbi:MAG: hypothetical protein QXO48_03235 [Desulfurococcaceae archaeon]
MRKIPIPLLLAALVSVTAVVITLKVTVVPIPLYVDPNFTGPIPAGNAVYWKGAFSEALFAANTTVDHRYFYGAAIAVYAPHGIPNATVIRGSPYRNLGDIIQFINLTSGVYLVSYYPGGFQFVVRLMPTSVDGFYIGQALTPDEIKVVDRINPNAIYTLAGGGYDATSDRFFVTYRDAAGYTYTAYMPTSGQGTGQIFNIQGYDISLNVDGKPIVVRYAAGVAIIPSSNTQVTIYVR